MFFVACCEIRYRGRTFNQCRHDLGAGRAVSSLLLVAGMIWLVCLRPEPCSAAVNPDWVRELVNPSVGSSRDLVALNIGDGIAVGYQNPDGVVLARRNGSGWNLETIVPRLDSGEAVGNFDIERIGGSLYAASAPSHLVPGGVETSVRIRSNRSGSWETIYQSPISSNQYGRFMDLHRVKGRVVAAYGGVEAPSLGTGTRRTHFLREDRSGEWSEAELPFFAQDSGDHLSVGKVNGRAAVLRSGRNAVRLMQEIRGSWQVTDVFDFHPFSRAELRDYQDTSVFAAFAKDLNFTGHDRVWYYQRTDSGWDSTLVDSEGLWLDGSDFEIIGGIPTMVYVARNHRTSVDQGTIHLRQFIDGSWTNQIVVSGEEATYTGAISLAELDGNPAFFTTRTSPAGTAWRLELYSMSPPIATVPEPAIAPFTGVLLMIALGRRTSRRGIRTARP